MVQLMVLKKRQKRGGSKSNNDKNAGVGAAIRTGIKYAQQENYDIVVVMAGDDQDLPSEMCSVLDPIIKNEADFVQGSRRLNELKVVNISLF